MNGYIILGNEVNTSTLGHFDQVSDPIDSKAESGERADRSDRCLDHCLRRIVQLTVFPSNRTGRKLDAVPQP